MRRVVSAVLIAVLVRSALDGRCHGDLPLPGPSHRPSRCRPSAACRSNRSPSRLRRIARCAVSRSAPSPPSRCRRSRASCFPNRRSSRSRSSAYDAISDLGDTLTNMTRFMPAAHVPAPVATAARYRLAGTPIIVASFAPTTPTLARPTDDTSRPRSRRRSAMTRPPHIAPRPRSARSNSAPRTATRSWPNSRRATNACRRSRRSTSASPVVRSRSISVVRTNA